MKQAVVLLAHGTVDDLAELPAFVTRIRRGHAAPPELVEELRRRYESIGGSPLNAINRRLAAKVEAKLGVTTRAANRLATPLLVDVLRELAASGVERVAEVPLAQYSAHLYAEATRAAADELAGADGGRGPRIDVACAASWAQEPDLVEAYAATCCEAMAQVDRAKATLVLSAHSLPVAAIRGGDPYESELRTCAASVIARVAARIGEVKHAFAFQSQGMSAGPGGRPVEWLGPNLLTTIDAAKARGDASVVFAPIGFLADHVEILYDLDVEARRWVEERGMTYHRTRSLDDGDALVSVIASVARPLLFAASAGV